MDYIIHVEVSGKSISHGKLIELCKRMGAEASYIVPIRNYTSLEGRHIVSRKCSGTGYEADLEAIVEILEKNRYEIGRKKVEIPFVGERYDGNSYLESRLTLVMNEGFSREYLYDVCRRNDFHASRDHLKEEDGYCCTVLVHRSSDDNDLINKTDKMREDLYFWKYGIREVVIRECIYDSNLSEDDYWFKKETPSVKPTRGDFSLPVYSGL